MTVNPSGGAITRICSSSVMERRAGKGAQGFSRDGQPGVVASVLVLRL